MVEWRGEKGNRVGDKESNIERCMGTRGEGEREGNGWRVKKGNRAGNRGGASRGGKGGRGFASCCCFMLFPLAAASSLYSC